MQACQSPSACNGLLSCIKLGCPLDATVFNCAEAECGTLLQTGGTELRALLQCLETNCPSCGITEPP